MEIMGFGIGTSHSPGAFCIRCVFDEYFITCFETPYLYEKEGELHMGNAGDILVHPPGHVVYHGDLPQGQFGFVNDWLRVAWKPMEDCLRRYPIPFNTPIPTMRKYALRSYMEDINDEMLLCEAGYTEYGESLLLQMMIQIHREAVRSKNRNIEKSRLEAARYAIMKHPEKNYTIDSLAKLCGYSAGQFSRLYKQMYGITPLQNLLNERIEAAKRLLIYGGMSIEDIALSCGFQNIYYFSRCFKMRTGIAPSAYAAERTKTQNQNAFG